MRETQRDGVLLLLEFHRSLNKKRCHSERSEGSQKHSSSQFL